jgi:endonuclease/exonuclease/phosphatase family metal-dependent hydrolase
LERAFLWLRGLSVAFVCFVAVALLWLLVLEPLTMQETEFVLPGSGVSPSHPYTISVLSANVGNSDPRCLPYWLKLCRKDVEARLAKNIKALKPDLIAIQETLPDDLLESFPVALPGNLTYEPGAPPQIRRLLGPNYTIVCEARNAFECIAVHVDAGEIVGCPKGDLCETERLDRQGEGCRWNVAIMAATVRIKGQTFDVVNAHPESRGAACRLFSIRQIFEDTGRPDSLVQEENAILMGDFNLDPWREDDVSTRYWNEQVGESGASGYLYHSGIAEHQPPYLTHRISFFRRTYDHIVSNFLSGTTQVLGESPETTRLDGGRGMDHRAVYGQLSFTPAP